MHSAETHPTPQHVVNAIHIVAAWLREIEAAEAVIAPTGGAAFHPERKADQLLAGWQEERDRLRAALGEVKSTLNLWPQSEWGYRDYRIDEIVQGALA